MRESVTKDEAIELLNAALSLDPEAMKALAFSRVECNEPLAVHPTIQVIRVGEKNMVGLMGILNGLFGVDDRGVGAIAMELESIDTEEPIVYTVENCRLTRFKRMPHETISRPENIDG
jgi:hypothetical protein